MNCNVPYQCKIFIFSTWVGVFLLARKWKIRSTERLQVGKLFPIIDFIAASRDVRGMKDIDVERLKRFRAALNDVDWVHWSQAMVDEIFISIFSGRRPSVVWVSWNYEKIFFLISSKITPIKIPDMANTELLHSRLWLLLDIVWRRSKKIPFFKSRMGWCLMGVLA